MPSARTTARSQPSAWERSTFAEAARIADLPDVDPTVRGTMDYGLCLVHNLKAEFDATLDRGGRRASGFVVPEPEVLGVALA